MNNKRKFNISFDESLNVQIKELADKVRPVDGVLSVTYSGVPGDGLTVTVDRPLITVLTDAGVMKLVKYIEYGVK